MSAGLALEQVHVTIGQRQILRGLSLHLAAGQIRALVGLNGTGKTTALRIALGMLRPDAGYVQIDDQDIWPYRPGLWNRVGHLVEVPSAYPELTARENIANAISLHGADARRGACRAEELAQALGLGERLDTRVRRLSLGTRQKVSLISALSHEPTVVVLDEPTNGLDSLAVVALREELRRLADGGSSILITSHHFDELARLAGHVDVLHDGRIIATITPDGSDLEKVFFDTVLAAEQTSQEAS